MPQLRLALAQVDSTSATSTATPPSSGSGRRGPGRRRPPRRLPRDAPHRLPVEDLALRSSFVDASRDSARAARPATWTPTAWATSPSSSATSTGSTGRAQRRGAPRRLRAEGAPQNSAAVLHRGRVVARYAKHHLPNYGVFDEFRIFTPGGT
jgi:NAD+ synthase (glutamine-hydrolysing)